ncbi:O-acetyltransferase PaAT-2 [Pseudocercospora fuligena]|uniref:O-acetyltransferase PaAT-2 n=1 Tax=Pseudocercospora fuligena TaxID=685502 RepID=A0A8H6VLB8_9PEZI|nr:O-acetyltransferase PaAT-2 [Pseudocercospora fuligena]
MEAIRQWWQASNAKQDHHDDDTIYPLHMLDDTRTLHSIVVAWTLRFDDVLDPEKLKDALSKLLEIGDWRKLGGRLRLKEDGSLELHSPNIYTAERPAFAYSQVEVATAIDEDPLARQLPKAAKSPSIQKGPELFQKFAAREDAPRTIDDFLRNDTPVLSLHITPFSDATLVAISWPHILMDVMGQQALVRNWSRVLAGEQSQVAPLLGARDDVLSIAAEAEDPNPEPFLVARQKLTGLGMLSFGSRMAWDVFWNTAETRSIFLSATAVSGLQERSRDELAKMRPGERPHLISINDILTAWMARIVSSSLPQPRPLTVLHAINTRFRLGTKLDRDDSGVYVQNMALASFTFLPAAALTAPIGIIADQNRTQFSMQSSEGQILAYLREVRSQPKGSRDPSTLCGPSDAVLMPFTNWDKADFFNAIDFSPAVVQRDEASGIQNTAAGTISYHHASSMQPNPMMRNVVIIYGKDRGGNYWLTGTFVPRIWSKIEEAVKELS